jgi:2-dehydropantoate 2-reductase
MSKRICIYGAGGVGGYLAVRLAQAGRDVSIVARGPHLEEIQRWGLTLRTATHESAVAVPARSDIGDFPAFDVVVVSVKAPALPMAAQAIGPHLARGTSVIFATNGVQWFYGDGFTPGGMRLDTRRLDRHGTLHREIGVERSLGMVVRSTNEVLEPGIIFNSGGGKFLLGEAAGGASERLQELASLLDVDGADVSASADIRRDMWTKLVRNTAVAVLCGLVDDSPGNVFSDSELGRLGRDVMAEVAAVAAAHGFDQLIDVESEAAIVAEMTAMKPSIVQDLERGRPMEIDAQLASVLDFAAQARVPTPVTSRLAPLLTYRARSAGCYAPFVPAPSIDTRDQLSA